MHCSKNPPYHLFRTMTVVIGNAVPGELGHRGISTHISYVLLAILSHPFIFVTTPINCFAATPLNCLTHATTPIQLFHCTHSASNHTYTTMHHASSHPLSYTATPVWLSNCTHSAAWPHPLNCPTTPKYLSNNTHSVAKPHALYSPSPCLLTSHTCTLPVPALPCLHLLLLPSHTHSLTTSLYTCHVVVGYALKLDPLYHNGLNGVMYLLVEQVAKVVHISTLTGDSDTL